MKLKKLLTIVVFMDKLMIFFSGAATFSLSIFTHAVTSQMLASQLSHQTVLNYNPSYCTPVISLMRAYVLWYLNVLIFNRFVSVLGTSRKSQRTFYNKCGQQESLCTVCIS
jgi:hypothetical protein